MGGLISASGASLRGEVELSRGISASRASEICWSRDRSTVETGHGAGLGTGRQVLNNCPSRSPPPSKDKTPISAGGFVVLFVVCSCFAFVSFFFFFFFFSLCFFEERW